jgi:hypothetical protein
LLVGDKIMSCGSNPRICRHLVLPCIIKEDIRSVFEVNTLVSLCFKYHHSKAQFSWAKIPEGECGEGNINREIGFKGSNLVRKAVHNCDSKNCNSFSAAGVKVQGLSRAVSPSKIENKLVSL